MSQNVDAVVLALYLLGGHSKAVDTEDVAKKAHEIAPDRFSWKKYSDQINLELVRVSLSDGKKESLGELIEGSGRDGWRLTPKGARWATENAHLLTDETFARPRESGLGGSIDERRWRSERQRILRSNAWTSWSGGRDIDPKDALALFRIDIYAVGGLRATKVARLVSQFAEDPEVSEFLHAAEQALPASSGPVSHS